MKLPSYSEALKKGKDKVKEALIPIRVKKTKKKAELEMLKLEEELATKEFELSEKCTEEDVNFPRIIELQNSTSLLKRKIKQYQLILDEMFPEDED